MRAFYELDWKNELNGRCQREGKFWLGVGRSREQVTHGLRLRWRSLQNDGTKEPVGAIDKQMREEYYPQGKREVWDDAAKVIFDQHRPALELIVAATLRAPWCSSRGSKAAC